MQAENLSPGVAPSDGGDQADDLKLEPVRSLTLDSRRDIARQSRSLTDGVLRGRWIELARVQRIRHQSAIAQRPHAGPVRYLKTIVRDDAPVLTPPRQTV